MAPAGTLKVAFYGDDFTGATDTLATAARAGLRTLLFLQLPTPAQLGAAGALDCLGIAGAARSMGPEEMRAELEAVGRLFAGLGAPVIHYKTCSTFDSAPHVGSIGVALRALQPHTGSAFVPIVGGQPSLRRYCLFGNLFAAAGEEICRIDRHPTMRKHPVTPMHEADLRLHLEKQGLAGVGSVAFTDYAKTPALLDAQLDAQTAGPVLMDVASGTDLQTIGRLIWERAVRAPLLAVGASSVVQALAAHWHLEDGASLPGIAPAQGPVLVLAGSLSPMTARQVSAATSYQHVSLDVVRLASDDRYLWQRASDMAALLRDGFHVLASTSDGAEASLVEGRTTARACGVLLARVLAAAPVKRLGIAGGDTSSHAVQALDAWGLSYQAQLAPGVALCRLHSDDRQLDGLEIMLKGGQMGDESLLEVLLSGKP
ncbi:MAG: four-carbon acid sugar kinase family protein [Pseudomonadota bacterium]